MASKKPDDKVSDEEAERRATEALRRALATPPKLQREMVGKSERRPASRKKRTRKA